MIDQIMVDHGVFFMVDHDFMVDHVMVEQVMSIMFLWSIRF